MWAVREKTEPVDPVDPAVGSVVLGVKDLTQRLLPLCVLPKALVS